jgi:DNA-binding response OmpR family regulator
MDDERATPQRCRILVVDDDSLSRRGLSRYLRNRGYRVVDASNGVEALKELERTQVDLVVTDLDMPGVDGFGLLRALQTDPNAPATLVVSGRSDERSLRSVRHLGAYGSLPKGTPPRDMLARIEAVLAMDAARGKEAPRPAPPATRAYSTQ